MSVPCIHRRLVDECAVCSAYWHYLHTRFEVPENTPTTRGLFWKYGEPVVLETAGLLRDGRIGDSPGPIA